MAQPDLENFTDRGVLIALAGVTLLAGTHGIQLLDGKSSTTADEEERNIDRTFLTNSASVMSNHRAMIEGKIEILCPTAPGHATDGIPPIAPALYPCALALTLNALLRTSTFTPISTAFARVDGAWYHAGTLISPTEMLGTLSNLRMEIGKPFTAMWKVEGPYEEETEAALPTIDLDAFEQPTVATYLNSDVRISSLGAAAISNLGLLAHYFTVSDGLNPQTIELSNDYKKTDISERKGTFEMLFARTDLDEFNPRALMRSAEQITLSWKLSEEDGRYSEQFCRGQITAVTDENYKGKRMVKISGKCIGNVPGVDYGLRFGDDTFALNGTISNGAETVAYVANGLTASGLYEGPLTWDISSGTLPAGLVIASGTGIISGTPEAATAGTINVTIRATDSTAGTPKVATKAVTFTITA